MLCHFAGLGLAVSAQACRCSIDHEFHECKAQVIEGNATWRSALMNMLRDVGIGYISQTSRMTDAQQELEIAMFDIVLCDHPFDKSLMSGV